MALADMFMNAFYVLHSFTDNVCIVSITIKTISVCLMTVRVLSLQILDIEGIFHKINNKYLHRPKTW